MKRKRDAEGTREQLHKVRVGWDQVRRDPAFEALTWMTRLCFDAQRVGKGGSAFIVPTGLVHVRAHADHEPEEWAYLLRHLLLHLGLGHVPDGRGKKTPEWSAAADVAAYQFLEATGTRGCPVRVSLEGIGPRDTEALYHLFRKQGIPDEVAAINPRGEGGASLELDAPELEWSNRLEGRMREYRSSFARGLREALKEGIEEGLYGSEEVEGVQGVRTIHEAYDWVISEFPLLSSVAAGMELVTSVRKCQTHDVWLAAIDPRAGLIYANPIRDLSKEEWIFIMVHEILHAALGHDQRREWRDAFVWNVACDFVINKWIVDMGVGKLPADILHDRSMRECAAEELYDELVPHRSKLARRWTPAGKGRGDILSEGTYREVDGMLMDEFYRRELAYGYSRMMGGRARGTIPAGLAQEIEAQIVEPIPWDVELGQWFQRNFERAERRRTYARPSRRQTSTPDIPRPSVKRRRRGESLLGVILDTSLSMNDDDLARGIGAVVSYARDREIDRVRLVFCDAEPYDGGWVRPRDLASVVEVRGRGGTTLQTAVDFVHRQKDIPEGTPLLIITDGCTDRLSVPLEHAYLLTPGGRLEFHTKAPVFEMSRKAASV